MLKRLDVTMEFRAPSFLRRVFYIEWMQLKRTDTLQEVQYNKRLNAS